MSLKTLAQQHENAWLVYELPASYLADFALSRLINLGKDEYSLIEIFSPSAIKALLTYSCQIINAQRVGNTLVSLGSGGIIAGPPDEGKRLEYLLRSWADKKWIVLSEIGGENSFNAELVDG